MEKLISKNPATGEILQEVPTTPIDQLPLIFNQARIAQKNWAALSVQARCQFLINAREVLLDQVDEVIKIISQENGKPPFEAMTNELLPCVDSLTYFAKKTPQHCKNKTIALTLMKHRKSYIQYWPLGVVGIISPWNYPFLLPFADILMAIATGNSVVFKPSEITPLIGLKIQEIWDHAGLPSHLLQTVIGDGTLGAALVQQKPNKIFFTGSVPTGKKLMAAAAEHLIPVNLELGGKDAMIVLPDADLDFATSAALWGAFSNSGQMCASVERILVHEKIAESFTQLLVKKSSILKHKKNLDCSLEEYDLGAITFEKQKETYQHHLEEAQKKGAQVILGGTFTENKKSLFPSILQGKNIEDTLIYQEETFGPVVAITTYQSIEEAIQKTNQSKYGLTASIITKNISQAEEIAKKLEVGTVTINEVAYTAGLGETPWGGVKESGFGKSHSAMGLYEFMNARHIHLPKMNFLTFKSLWWFPYTNTQYVTLRKFFEFYRKNWFDKIKAFPSFFIHFIEFIKKEKRL